MTRSTPAIHNTALLCYEEEQEISIVVGSEQWFEWLCRDTSTIFSFHSFDGTYTARKEHAGNRRGGWYWKTYCKYRGRLYRAYLGKPGDLTMERLSENALTLSTRMQEQAKRAQDVSESGYQDHRQTYSATVVTPLLETKLHPPRLPARLVERTRLLTLLDFAHLS